MAGYLFGIAGELAVKELLRSSGIKPSGDRNEDRFFAHFPALKQMLGVVSGHRAGELRSLSEDPRLFQNWDVSMRYAPTSDVDPAWVDSWKASAEHLVTRMEME